MSSWFFFTVELNHILCYPKPGLAARTERFQQLSEAEFPLYEIVYSPKYLHLQYFIKMREKACTCGSSTLKYVDGV